MEPQSDDEQSYKLYMCRLIYNVYITKMSSVKQRLVRGNLCSCMSIYLITEIHIITTKDGSCLLHRHFLGQTSHIHCKTIEG